MIIFSKGRTDCQITAPYCHIKMASRTDFTSIYGSPPSEPAEKSFGNDLMANCTFGNIFWRAPFLSCTIHAQKMAGLFGEAGIIIRQSTTLNPSKMHNENIVVNLVISCYY